MKALPALFAIVLMATPAVLSAAAFEGKLKMKMTDSRGTAREVDYCIKPDYLRADVEMGKEEKMSMITDMKKQEMIILMPGQNMYMTRPMSDLTAAAERNADDASFEKTGETEKILGYTCVKYVSKSKNLTSDIWATDQLGKFIGFSNGGGGPMGGKKSAPPAWEKALAGKDFFPLRVVTLNSKGKEEFRLEAVAIEKGEQPAALFAPPPGARKFDMGGLMQGLGFPGKKN